MKSLIISIFVVGFSMQSYAQSSINTTGNNVSGSNGNVTYSIGEVFYDTAISSTGSVAAGVQQPYEITETLGVDVTEINLSLKIYPNPTPDILNLKVGFNDYKKYNYEIFDGSGKSLITKPIRESQTSIRMASYPAAIYYLKIMKDGKVIKIFKVLKTDK